MLSVRRRRPPQDRRPGPVPGPAGGSAATANIGPWPRPRATSPAGPGRSVPARPGVLSFPEIVLAREPRRFAVEGRVLDRKGRPVAGAEVCGPRPTAPAAGGPRPTSTASSGWKTWPKAATSCSPRPTATDSPAATIDPSRGPLDLTLTRLDEAPDASMTTRPSARPALATGPGRPGPLCRAGPEPRRPRDPGPDPRAARPDRPEAGPGPDRRPGGRGRLVRRPPPAAARAA